MKWLVDLWNLVVKILSELCYSCQLMNHDHGITKSE